MNERNIPKHVLSAFYETRKRSASCSYCKIYQKCKKDTTISEQCYNIFLEAFVKGNNYGAKRMATIVCNKMLFTQQILCYLREVFIEKETVLKNRRKKKYEGLSDKEIENIIHENKKRLYKKKINTKRDKLNCTINIIKDE